MSHSEQNDSPYKHGTDDFDFRVYCPDDTHIDNLYNSEHFAAGKHSANSPHYMCAHMSFKCGFNDL